MKRLALFCDGTWNRADQAVEGAPCPTNVLKLAACVRPRDGAIAQLTYYDHGVGTGNSLDRLTGGAFGHGLADNLFEAYRFVVLNYEPGDALYLFGFSRGAYTVRSLAGLIRCCGILDRAQMHRYREAIALYSDALAPDDDAPVRFRSQSCTARGARIPIRMIGVWDTVGALGIPLRGLRALTRRQYRFHDVRLSRSVERAYQALAIDERRAPLAPTLWAAPARAGQRIEQVWFAGVHSDVGGGYAPGQWGLSDLTLEWMQHKAIDAGLAIDLLPDRTWSPRGDALAPLHDSHRGLYRLTRHAPRVIGRPAGDTAPAREYDAALDPTQSLHPSVLARWDADPGYRPENLRRYFALIGDARGHAPRLQPACRPMPTSHAAMRHRDG